MVGQVRCLGLGVVKQASCDQVARLSNKDNCTYKQAGCVLVDEQLSSGHLSDTRLCCLAGGSNLRCDTTA